jgi:hypothetical protein
VVLGDLAAREDLEAPAVHKHQAASGGWIGFGSCSKVRAIISKIFMRAQCRELQQLSFSLHRVACKSHRRC